MFEIVNVWKFYCLRQLEWQCYTSIQNGWVIDRSTIDYLSMHFVPMRCTTASCHWIVPLRCTTKLYHCVVHYNQLYHCNCTTTFYRCIAPLRCTTILYHCVVPLHCTTALYHCVVPLHCTTTLYHCIYTNTLGLRFSIFIIYFMFLTDIWPVIAVYYYYYYYYYCTTAMYHCVVLYSVKLFKPPTIGCLQTFFGDPAGRRPIKKIIILLNVSLINLVNCLKIPGSKKWEWRCTAVSSHHAGRNNAADQDAICRAARPNHTLCSHI